MRRIRLATRPLHTVGAVALLLAAALPASATLIAYEGFDYAEGDVAGLEGGTGWSAAWTGSNNATTGPTVNVAAGGLSYSDALGNPLMVSGRSAVATASTDQTDGTAERNLTSFVGASDSTTWWSFIGQRLQPHATADENLIRASSLQLRVISPLNERLAVGKGTTAAPAQTNWSMLHSATAANAVYSNDPILTKSFLVLRIDHISDSTTPDNAWLWVNPNLNAEPATAAADASLTAPVDFGFDQIRVFTGRTNATGPFASFAFDEIRVGTTFADVAPIATALPPNANFDGDSEVDGADFLIWQKNLGAPNQMTNANGDADRNGTVGASDLGVWKTQFGPTAATAIPEPATFGLAVMCLTASRAANRRRAR